MWTQLKCVVSERTEELSLRVLSPVPWKLGVDGDRTGSNSDENERSFHYYYYYQPRQHPFFFPFFYISSNPFPFFFVNNNLFLFKKMLFSLEMKIVKYNELNINCERLKQHMKNPHKMRFVHAFQMRMSMYPFFNYYTL